MLFDLRSRRRKGAVRVIYLFLALVMVAGLVLVGVGTGSNNGGLLNAFTNNSSNSGQNGAVTAQVKQALNETKKHPSSASAWADLIRARFEAAGTGSNYNSTTGAYTNDGKKQLKAGVNAWNRYLSLTNDKPELNLSILAAEMNQSLESWAGASIAWQYAAQDESSDPADALKPYLCLALNSYAAKQKSQGELAAAKALQLAPKLERLEIKSELSSAKSSATTAQQSVVENC